MSDVRLTATNPEDSSVVPVACNDRGELLLQEPDINVDDFVATAGDEMTGDLTLRLDAETPPLILSAAGEASTPRITIGEGEDVTVEVQARGAALFDQQVTTDFVLARGGGNSPTSYATPAGYTSVLVGTKSGEDNWVRFSGEYNAAVGTGAYIQFAPTFRNKGESAGMYFGGVARSATNTELVIGNVQANAGDANAVLTEAIVFTNAGAASFSSDVVVGSRGQTWMIVESNGLAHLVSQTALNADTADLVDTVDGEAPPVVYPELRDIPGELTMVEQQLQKVLEKLRMVPEAGWEVWDGSD